MNAHKTVLLLTLGTLLAACGAVTTPSGTPQAAVSMHALEECHGCGINASTSGSVDHFWAWPSDLRVGWNDLHTDLHGLPPFPVKVPFPAPVRGQVVDQRSGVILLTLQPSELLTQDDWLSLACVSAEARDRPENLSPQDGN